MVVVHHYGGWHSHASASQSPVRWWWHSPRTSSDKYAAAGCPRGVVLEVEQVLCVLGQRSHPGMEVRALEVGHGLKMLLPYEVLLIPNWEKRDRQCCSIGEVVLAQGGESDVRHQLNAGVGLTADDGSRPQLRGVITLTSHWSMP
jgi:hypothetical protein